MRFLTSALLALSTATGPIEPIERAICEKQLDFLVAAIESWMKEGHMYAIAKGERQFETVLKIRELQESGGLGSSGDVFGFFPRRF
jgi:hypothetical protein